MKTNNKIFFANVVIDNEVVAKSYYILREGSRSLSLKYDDDTKEIIIYAPNLETINKYRETIIKDSIKLYRRVVRKSQKQNTLILSYNENDHYIHLLGKKIFLKWNYVDTIAKLWFKYDYDASNQTLTISTSIAKKTDEEARKKVFLEVLKQYLDLYLNELTIYYCKKMNIFPKPDYQITMKNAAWGTMYTDRRTNKSHARYSVKLVALEPYYIEYVVAHELAHYFVHNHSQDFYDKGKMFIEDFEERNKSLNKNTVIFTNDLTTTKNNE